MGSLLRKGYALSFSLPLSLPSDCGLMWQDAIQCHADQGSALGMVEQQDGRRVGFWHLELPYQS